jgi:hypothetical protein
MYYASVKPKVVGEFDAGDLNRRIDEYADGRPDLFTFDFIRGLASPDTTHPGMGDVLHIAWKHFFRPRAFGGHYMDGQISEIEFIKPEVRDTSIDSWHADTTSSNRRKVYPETLTTAARWPTEFLIGNIAVSKTLFKDQHGHLQWQFWSSATGETLINQAMEKGDAYIHTFEPGEIIKVPKGTLHRRSIPAEASGYRYFMRHFPRQDLFRTGTNRGRIRHL